MNLSTMIFILVCDLRYILYFQPIPFLSDIYGGGLSICLRDLTSLYLLHLLQESLFMLICLSTNRILYEIIK